MSVQSGLQAARFSAAGLSLSTWWYAAVNAAITPAAPIVTVEADIRISTTGTPSASWGLDIFDASLRRLAYVFYSEATGTLWVFRPDSQQSIDTGIPIVRGSWNRWSVVIDFQIRQSQFMLDGVPVGPAAAFGTNPAPGMTFGDADIRVTGPGSDALELDHYSVTTQPAPPAACPGDTNGDQHVNGADLSVLLFNFGSAAPGPEGGDFNGDGVCDGADLSVLLFLFGTQCR